MVNKYTVNYNIDDLVSLYTKELVMKIVREDHPEIYRKAKKTIKKLLKESNNKKT